MQPQNNYIIIEKVTKETSTNFAGMPDNTYEYIVVNPGTSDFKTGDNVVPVLKEAIHVQDDYLAIKPEFIVAKI